MARDGWIRIQEAVEGTGGASGKYIFKQSYIWHKDSPDSDYKLVMEWWGINFTKSGVYQLRFSIINKDGSVNFPINADTWADWDQQGRLVFANKGRLFVATIFGEKLDIKLLAEFTDQKPESIQAPDWAKSW